MKRLAGVLRRAPDTVIYPSLVQLLLRGQDDHHVARESIDVHWEPYAAHCAARSLMRQVSSRTVQDTLTVAPQLPTLPLPVHVVWGTKDPFQKLADGQRIAADLGTALVRIPTGRRFTPEDHPEEIAEAINELTGSA